MRTSLSEQVLVQVQIHTHQPERLKASLDSLLPSHNTFIWHREPLGTTLTTPPSLASPHWLTTTVNVGESLEDEWEIVSILLKLSEICEDAVIRVTDGDGEVLLIETEPWLPEWLRDEDEGRRRCWIYRGQVHVVPKIQSPADVGLVPEGDTVDLDKAVDVIRDERVSTALCHEAQQHIQSKCKGSNNTYQCTLFIPRKLATVLDAHPNLISAASEAFHGRDSVGMSYVRSLSTFSPVGMVEYTARFSRRQFAQLRLSPFHPPRRHYPSRPENVSLRAYEMGYKVLAGFEIFVNDPLYSGGTVEGPRGDKNWVKFRTNLERTGYFKDTIEGSQQYKKLYSQARREYKEFSKGINDSGDCAKYYRGLQEQIEKASGEGDSSRVEGPVLDEDIDEGWLTEESPLDGAFDLESEMIERLKRVVEFGESAVGEGLEKSVTTQPETETFSGRNKGHAKTEADARDPFVSPEAVDPDEVTPIVFNERKFLDTVLWARTLMKLDHQCPADDDQDSNSSASDADEVQEELLGFHAQDDREGIAKSLLEEQLLGPMSHLLRSSLGQEANSKGREQNSVAVP